MTVPQDIYPAELSELIQHMTKLAPEERPGVDEVDESLSRIFEKLADEGKTAQFLGTT
ncbi:MAG: hypothetical protein HC767_05850 [Akkermansiaceae bacterium]|nr:hypothetical protein [Akkermansiaceae bacterium]